MTVIVGLVDRGFVYIGGDSAGVAGLDITPRKDEKVWIDDEFAFGFTSSFRMGQILRYSFSPPEIKNIDLMRYMCTDFIDEVRKALKDGGFARVDSNEEKGGMFLVGVRGRLFTIDSDFQVGESLHGYDSVGCGYAYALGSLNSTEGDPRKRVALALETAEKFSAGVCGPFNIAMVG